MLRASLWVSEASGFAISPKLDVPVSAFQPDISFRISSAVEIMQVLRAGGTLFGHIECVVEDQTWVYVTASGAA
jgi:hypothetical protein